MVHSSPSTTPLEDDRKAMQSLKTLHLFSVELKKHIQRFTYSDSKCVVLCFDRVKNPEKKIDRDFWGIPSHCREKVPHKSYSSGWKGKYEGLSHLIEFKI